MSFALLAIALLALWTRVQYIDLYGGRADSYNAWANDHYFGGISSFYLSTSDELAAGASYTTMHHPPGYSYVLATLKVAGIRSIGAIRITQSAFDALVVIVVYSLARRLGVTRGWSLAASGLYAVWPLFAQGATWPLAEALSVPLVAIALLLLLFTAQQGNASGLAAAAMSGLTIGGGALVRPDLVLLIVPATIWTAVASNEHALRKVMAVLVACTIPIAAWGVHNRRTNGVWLFGSTSSGLGLWEGLGEQPNSYGFVLDDSAANHALMAQGLKWSSVEADKHFRREYFNAWREHPAFVLRAVAARVPKILFESEHLQPLFLGRARQLLDAVGILLVIVAAWLQWRNKAIWLVLLLPPLYAVLSIGLVHYEPRYVRYVQLSYVLAVVVIADDGWRRFVRSHGRVAAATVLLVIAGAYVARELHALHRAASVMVAR